MSLARFAKLALPAATMIALGACAPTPFRADVARFQAMPAPAGQTFTVVPFDKRNEGGLEFSQYASMVSRQLQAQGYTPAPAGSPGTLRVVVDYGVDNGRERVVTRPGIGGGFGYGYGYYRRGFYNPWFYGWNDPYFGGPEVSSFTVYDSFLDMTIERAADGQNVFEGHAKAMSRGRSLPALVPNLVQAMFTNFPGGSGETVRITVPTPTNQR